MKYTIEDLKNGKCAVKNDGTLEELREVLRLAFPKDKSNCNGYEECYTQGSWGDWNGTCSERNELPIQSVKYFLKKPSSSDIVEKINQDLDCHIKDLKESKVNEIADKLMQDYDKCNESFEKSTLNVLSKSFSPQPHYNNDNGSLYKIAEQRGWNARTFDVVKRLDRGGKKDPLRQEIEKSIDVLKLWLLELED